MSSAKAPANRDESVALVRFASTLALASGDARFQATASEAMRYLSTDSVALRPLSAEFCSPTKDANDAPIHVTVFGSPSAPESAAMHTAALRSITSHELIEVRNRAVPSPLPTAVEYPHLNHPALFLCTARS